MFWEPLWRRVFLVLLLESVLALGAWMALNPGPLWANPGTFPTVIAWAALALLLIVVSQAPARVPLVVWAAAALVLFPALVVGTRALDSASVLVAERVVDARVVGTVHPVRNGMWHAPVRLPDGRIVTVWSVTEDREDHRSYGGSNSMRRALLQLPRLPFETPATTTPVLVDRTGMSYSRFAFGDEGSPADRGRNIAWVVAGVLLWLPVQAVAVSALLRRRSWWSRLGEDRPTEP